MRALGLFEQLADIVLRAVVEALAFEELSIAKNRGERIVELMGNTGNQLAYGRHFFTLQELFLGLPQVFVRAAGLFVQTNLFDGGGELAADGNEEIFVVVGVFVA